MVHILLVILKIIGILLLVLLGLFLGILLLVLLAPVRYRADVSKQENIQGRVQVSWLLHLISITAEYQEGLSFQVKFLGFSIFPRKETAEEKPAESLPSAKEKPAAENKAISEKKTIVKNETAKNETGKKETAAENKATSEKKTASEKKVSAKHEAIEKRENISEDENAGFSEEEWNRVQTGHRSKPAEAETVPQPENAETVPQPENAETAPQKKTAPFHLASVFQTCLESIKRRIQGILDIFRAKIQALAAQWNQKRALAEKAYRFVTSPENQATFRLVIRQGKRIIRHCLPRKIHGAVTIGFENPAQTGNVLAVIAVFYPVYRNQLQVTPVFGEKILEGECSCRGHIRLGTLLVLAVRLLFDRNLRSLIKKYIRRS